MIVNDINFAQIKDLITGVLVDGQTLMIEAVSESFIPTLSSLEQSSHTLEVSSKPCSNWILRREEFPELVRIVQGKAPGGENDVAVSLSTKKHAVEVLNNWRDRHRFAVHYLEFACENGIAFGTFDPDEEGVTCSMFYYWYGVIGGLGTKPRLRNRGLASQVMLTTTGFGFDGLGLDTVQAYIEDANKESVNLVTKLGYKRNGNDRVSFLTFYPKCFPKAINKL